MKSFTSASGQTIGADVAPASGAARLAGEIALELAQRRAHLGDDRDPAGLLPGLGGLQFVARGHRRRIERAGGSTAAASKSGRPAWSRTARPTAR